MDNGISLYLYISKAYDHAQLKMLFGKEKMLKNDHFTEENIKNNNKFGKQVINLIATCR